MGDPLHCPQTGKKPNVLYPHKPWNTSTSPVSFRAHSCWHRSSLVPYHWPNTQCSELSSRSLCSLLYQPALSYWKDGGAHVKARCVHSKPFLTQESSHAASPHAALFYCFFPPSSQLRFSFNSLKFHSSISKIAQREKVPSSIPGTTW